MEIKIRNAEDYQVLTITPSDEGGIFSLEEIKTLPEIKIDPRKWVILDGRAPIWVYARLVHFCHPAIWVAVNSPRDGGAVVVASHHREVREGDVIPF